jgi:hypothetical protein
MKPGSTVPPFSRAVSLQLTVEASSRCLHPAVTGGRLDARPSCVTALAAYARNWE